MPEEHGYSKFGVAESEYELTFFEMIKQRSFAPLRRAVAYGGASAEDGFPVAGIWRWKPSCSAALVFA